VGSAVADGSPEALLAPYGEFEFLDVTKFPKTRAERVAMDMAPLSLNTAVNNTHTRCRVHMVDYAYNFLINAQPESMEQRSYLTKAPLGPKKVELFDGAKGYVVFPVGATSDNKLFRASVMGPVMRGAWTTTTRSSSSARRRATRRRKSTAR
jgi:hypothetical protein